MKQRQRRPVKIVETKVKVYTERRGRKVSARWRKPKSMTSNRYELSIKERPGNQLARC